MRCKQELVTRLQTAQGHLSAVIKMVEKDRSCEEVLHQMTAIKGALNAASSLMLKDQFQSSLDRIRFDPSPDQRCAELSRLLDFYRIVSQESQF